MTKGIIMKVKEKYSIVMTKQGSYQRIKNKGEMVVGQEVLFLADDHYQKQTHYRSYLAVAAILLLMIALGSSYYIGNTSVYAVVTVDINPSVEIFLNKHDEVIGIDYLNEDAKTLSLEAIEGLSVEDALEIIVEEAKAKGFILEEEESYVLVTTVAMKGNEGKKNESLKVIIEEKIEESEALQEVNVALIKSTKVELREAEEKKVPLGLLVIEGQVSSTSVKEYFSDEKNEEAFKAQGNIVEKKDAKRIETIEKFLAKIEDESDDLAALTFIASAKEQLNEGPVSLKALEQEVKAYWNQIEDEDEDEDDDEDEDKPNGRSLEKDKEALEKVLSKLERIEEAYPEVATFIAEARALLQSEEATEAAIEAKEEAGKALWDRLEDEDDDDDVDAVASASTADDNSNGRSLDKDKEALEKVLSKLERIEDKYPEVATFIAEARALLQSEEATEAAIEAKEEAGKALWDRLEEDDEDEDEDIDDDHEEDLAEDLAELNGYVARIKAMDIQTDEVNAFLADYQAHKDSQDPDVIDQLKDRAEELYEKYEDEKPSLEDDDDDDDDDKDHDKEKDDDDEDEED